MLLKLMTPVPQDRSLFFVKNNFGEVVDEHELLGF
ncbi:hypothetical protein Pmgp_02764 [Pelotomaculum propionicicum]|mgnify:CR=1 FL=1|uniref:Uncharacterized protein n=1 Tax=Pelotomaculum propionicicum TaxID=258475 RepID=A0A4Y7RMB9_9FIRM|nr:hypothetical protein Pmgp_02764 [Pelotomaculum propionicicum]